MIESLLDLVIKRIDEVSYGIDKLKRTMTYIMILLIGILLVLLLR